MRRDLLAMLDPALEWNEPLNLAEQIRSGASEPAAQVAGPEQ